MPAPAPAACRASPLLDARSRAVATGPKALAATGDFLLENDLVRVVLDAPDHPQGLAPSGGSIIDLAPVDADVRAIRSTAFYQAAGLLPRDAVHYETAQIDEHRRQNVGDAYVAVVFRGHLEGDRRVTVVTRYELRAVRARRARAQRSLQRRARSQHALPHRRLVLGRSHARSLRARRRGSAFARPSWTCCTSISAWREWPFVAARSQASPDVSYAVVPCDRAAGGRVQQHRR